jgi:hypothetical protein
MLPQLTRVFNDATEMISGVLLCNLVLLASAKSRRFSVASPAENGVRIGKNARMRPARLEELTISADSQSDHSWPTPPNEPLAAIARLPPVQLDSCNLVDQHSHLVSRVNVRRKRLCPRDAEPVPAPKVRTAYCVNWLIHGSCSPQLLSCVLSDDSRYTTERFWSHPFYRRLTLFPLDDVYVRKRGMA